MTTTQKRLFVYATVLNNAEWVTDCIASVERLKPEQITITDAGSTDGTKQLLDEMSVKYENILIAQEPSSRGKGRQIALDLIYNIANDDDLVMYADCDDVYSDYFVDYIRQKSKVVKDNEIYNFGLMNASSAITFS
jgi:glycosyltransferase involved in cell wall biosynthesis